MKRFALLLLVLLLILPVSAQGGLICDQADLLSLEEEYQLDSLSREIQASWGLDAVIVTVDSLEGQYARDYADDHFDYGGYSEDGILLLIAMNEREWHISTSGKAQALFSDRDLYTLEEIILPGLSRGDYYGSFLNFLSSIPGFCEDYEQANQPRGFGSIFFTSLLAGLVAAGIALLAMRGAMNTKRPQRSAQDYMASGSYRMGLHQDLFLYSQVSRRRKPQQNSSGSTTHRSSSGRSHGGRGGKF